MNRSLAMSHNRYVSDYVSVIIPTLNEGRYLPGLLDALCRQTRQPDEIIVADAGSSDDTLEIARRAGARVVTGGLPARGRNAGAWKANGILLLFLDADVLPAPDFITDMLREFEGQGLDVATSLISPLSRRRSDRMVCDMTNLFLQMVQVVAPHAPGFCILINHHLHDAIDGFDETVAMGEDHDYVQRAAGYGEFGVLTSVRIPVSVRRLEKEGVVRLSAKYFYCELYALAGRPIRSAPFVYEFGNFTRPAARHRFVDVGWLRGQLGSVENPLGQLSERGLSVLESIGSLRLNPEAFEQRTQALLPDEVRLLRRYLRFRLTVLRRVGRPRLRPLLKRFREADVSESIALVDQDLWRMDAENADAEEEE